MSERERFEGWWDYEWSRIGRPATLTVMQAKNTAYSCLSSALAAAPAAPAKRCEPCRQAGMIHCAHPDECGGPWSDAPKETP